MMGEYRQLKMRRDMSIPLPALPAMPHGFSVHSDDGTCAGAWEWIISASFGQKHSYDMILNDPSCARERVFFVKEYSQDVGTAAVQLCDGAATLHMVGVHPVGEGRGIAKYVVHAALRCMAELGVPYADLMTDDYRLSAIVEYLQMGFEPVVDDDEMAARWQAVREKIAAFQKTPREVIPLWPSGDIPYWQEGQCIPTLEAYPAEGARGAVVVCPGGGYYIKASHEGVHVARMLNAAGISAYVLDYRVHPCHFEAPLTDALRAIRVLRHRGYRKVAILGFSAGGHLACSAATLYDEGKRDASDPIDRNSSRPDAFIPCYPIVSLMLDRSAGLRNTLLGDRANDEALCKRFSAELNIDERTSPAFIWHTAQDDGVPPENSRRLAKALEDKGVPCELHIFSVGLHGLGLAGGVPEVEKWPAFCQQWLLKQGYGAGKKT